MLPVDLVTHSEMLLDLNFSFARQSCLTSVAFVVLVSFVRAGRPRDPRADLELSQTRRVMEVVPVSALRHDPHARAVFVVDLAHRRSELDYVGSHFLPWQQLWCHERLAEVKSA